MSNASWLDGLNEQQALAVTAPLGNVLVLAGAGSGKTRVLVNRMAWLIENERLSPHALLAVTFTNKAAQEMKTRLKRVLDCSIEGLWVGTFHGLCHRLLRRHHEEARLPKEFHILDSDDQARILKRVIASLHLDSEQWPVKNAQGFINARKDEGLRASQVVVPSYGPLRTWLAIYQEYERVCQSAGVVDFAELMLRTHELLKNNSDILAHYQQRFQAILVDEFQDTNTIQYAWIRLLAGNQNRVMAVGDDDQSIYGWRGAKVENIQRFSRDFSNTTIIRLEQNYRSTSTILQAANALIANNQSRMGKDLWTKGHMGEKIVLFSAFNELEEARFVTDRIRTEIIKGRPLNDIAILYRSNAQSRVLEEALLRADIAYRIHGGMRFYERAEVKDTLSYLRLLLNVDDDAAFERVVNFPARGIGEKTLDELRTVAKNQQQSLWQAALQMIESRMLTERAASALRRFLSLITLLKEKTSLLSLDEQMAEVIQASGLQAHYAKMKGDTAESKLDNLQELINAAKQFRYEEDNELPPLVAFLAHASLEAGETQASEHEAYVHMMTLHAAKGLEFPFVFLVGMEEGVFPGKQTQSEPERLEEERRLCYVGMTRAMEQLILSYAEIRRQYGREEYHRPSRFLKELPAQFIDEVRTKMRFNPGNASAGVTAKINESGFQLGQTVMHPKFGQGTILAMEGSGAHLRVQVRFVEHDTKWLVLAYANLTT